MGQSTLNIATDIEMRAYSLSKRGDIVFVLSASLLMAVLRNADYEDIEKLAEGDDDFYGVFIDRHELGNFVYEHTLDEFQQIAQLELDERNESSKDAWDTEIELRKIQEEVL